MEPVSFLSPPLTAPESILQTIVIHYKLLRSKQNQPRIANNLHIFYTKNFSSCNNDIKTKIHGIFHVWKMERGTLKALFKPFGLLCSDVASPPPRTCTACCSLQHLFQNLIFLIDLLILLILLLLLKTSETLSPPQTVHMALIKNEKEKEFQQENRKKRGNYNSDSIFLLGTRMERKKIVVWDHWTTRFSRSKISVVPFTK